MTINLTRVGVLLCTVTTYCGIPYFSYYFYHILYLFTRLEDRLGNSKCGLNIWYRGIHIIKDKKRHKRI